MQGNLLFMAMEELLMSFCQEFGEINQRRLGPASQLIKIRSGDFPQIL